MTLEPVSGPRRTRAGLEPGLKWNERRAVRGVRLRRPDVSTAWTVTHSGDSRAHASGQIIRERVHYGWNWLKFKQNLPPAIFHKNVPKMMILTQPDIYLEVFSWFQLISADFDCFSLNSEVLTNFAYNPSSKLMFSPVTSVSVMKISWYQLILDKICFLTAFDSF